MKAYFFGIVAIVTLIFCLVFWQQIAEAILLVGTVTAAIVGIGGVMSLFFGGWNLLERIRMTRAQRIEAEKQANTLIIAGEHGVYVRERDKQAVWISLHQIPNWRVNGTPVDPTPAEMATYQAFLASRHARPALPAPAAPLMIEAQAIAELLPIVDSAQRVLIIGASGTGKTNVLQWLVSRRGVGVLVIDPHASPGKWQGAKVVGIGSNFNEIEATLNNLIELMVSRYKEIGQGLVREGEHPRLTIIIDEWMSIAYQCRNAHDVLVRLLTESRKAAFSVIIGSHSERVKSLGLDGKGDLKDGFLFIRLWLESTGERRGTFDDGRGQRPCVLPGKYEPAQDAPIIEIEAIGEVKPSEEEQQVLALKATGASHRAISTEVWGQVGQFYNQKIDTILIKYGEK